MIVAPSALLGYPMFIQRSVGTNNGARNDCAAPFLFVIILNWEEKTKDAVHTYALVFLWKLSYKFPLISCTSMPLSSFIRVTIHAHLVLLNFNIQIKFGEVYQLCRHFVYFLPSSWHFIPFCPCIPFRILLSNAFSQCSSVNVRDQVSHQYKNSSKIIILNMTMTMTYEG